MNKCVGGICLPLKFEFNMIVYILIVVILGTSAVMFKSKRGKVLGIVVRFILGGAFIYLFNLIAKFVNVSLPLNPITALIIGFLEVPGFALLLILRYVIYP
ncbi:MAG: pro-sigmaK processing inhibitor BofA [Clostridiales bacterium]|jgi:inhibitor of the pro-sigma K processing machinery|nr:pro-sigmaK processing inhibitor BofA [Clostridiales bacterium]